MNRREEILEKERVIAQVEYELEIVNRDIKLLKQDPDVQKYIELISESKAVYEYIKLTNNLRNKKAFVENRKASLKELIKNPCIHQLVLVDDDITKEKDLYSCTCIDCGERIFVNLDDYYIYRTNNFLNDGISNIKMNYHRLLNNGSASEERIAIVDKVERKKVKSRK